MNMQNVLKDEFNASITHSMADRLSALAIIALGAGMVLFTLFAPISSVHNAAHDTRHAVVAPCH